MSSSHVVLPPPLVDGQLSLEAAIAHRCRVSPYIEVQVAAEEIGQLLWAAHTVADAHKGTSGATRLNLYACRGDGVWRYHPLEHCLTRHLNQDVRDVLSDSEFDSERVRRTLILSRQEEPTYLLPVGWPAQSD